MTIKPKLLLVDDDPDIHNFIQHELSGSSFELYSAFSAQEAIDLLGDHHFTMGLIDIVLGTTETSEKLIQFFKEDMAGKNQHLPMAIMSAHMDEAYGKKIRLKGPTVFAALKKPLKPKQVLNLLSGSLGGSVLIVHPKLEGLKSLKSELEKSEFQLFTTYCLSQAQGLLESTQFMAVVVDNEISNDIEFDSFLATNRKRFNLPCLITGTDANSSFVRSKDPLVFDFIEEPLKNESLLKALEKVKRWQESDQEDKALVTRVTEDLQEEVFQVKGLEESLNEEAQIISSHAEDSESSQTITGSLEDLGEEVSLIKGHSDEEEDSVRTIKGDKVDIGEEFWTVKNIGHENIDSEAGEFDPNKRNSQGVTPLMATCYLGELEQVQKMISLGGNPRLKAKNGKTLVHFAAFSGNPDLVDFLISEQGLKTNDRDLEKREPMYDAIKGDNADVVQSLIDLGARYTLKVDGKSYLALATQRGSSLIMEKFLTLGLSPKEKDYDGKSCIDHIQKMGRKDLAEIIKKYL